MKWKHSGSPSTKKIKTQSSAGKVANKLKPAIRTKHRSLLLKKVLLLHENARPRTAAQTVETANHLGFEALEHPVSSPDLGPSNYHRFGSLNDGFRGHRFPTDNDAKEAVHKWLHDQPKTFFLEGKRELVDRWTKCIEKEGDHIER
ncbi:histone-lysine N-methyltransferase SETMAR-like [Octopus sinensis]|uniref:Histone-lysine N-methyltransferase SETMAR-like n=1 Tax=Octopus sinensis TaxID=2607531 RepID=A0A6P7SNS7_9MOLL|nr:histone-lysine N-methyltransferase SETMAR-like [Octopus sinensis]